MKLKPIFASIMALGLVSGAAYAADQNVGTAMNSQVDEMMDLINANSPNSNTHFVNWADRVRLSGIANVDLRYASRGMPFGTTNFTSSTSSWDLNVRNANLFADVAVNNMVNAHVGVAYIGNNVMYDNIPGATDRGSIFNQNGSLQLDEAYVTIDDFSRSPVYGKVGKMYTSFGNYSDYDNPNVNGVFPIIYPFTQLLSQYRATAGELGFVTPGVYGNAFIAGGENSSTSTSGQTRLANGGAELGYHGAFNSTNFNVNAGWLRQIRDVDYLTVVDSVAGVTLKRTGAVQLHADGSNGPFGLRADYVRALGNVVSGDDSSRVWAVSGDGDYNFTLGGYKTQVGIGADHSAQGKALLLPETRVDAHGTVYPFPNTAFSLLYAHDWNYSNPSSNNGPGKHADTVVGSVGVQF